MMVDKLDKEAFIGRMTRTRQAPRPGRQGRVRTARTRKGRKPPIWASYAPMNVSRGPRRPAGRRARRGRKPRMTPGSPEALRGRPDEPAGGGPEGLRRV